MKYKDFKKWCARRARDGVWTTKVSINCVTIMNQVDRLPFWKRERAWKEIEIDVMVNIIIPININMWKQFGCGDLPIT